MKKFLAVLICFAGIGALVYALAQRLLPFTCSAWKSKLLPAVKIHQPK